MALAPGTHVGPYEIVGLIGSGGMGEVYRARDTHLDRDVAIKVLPDAVAQDAQRLARFEREARTLAALCHAHIAQIHGLEKSAGQTAIVMELVEGSTLSDRLARGPLSIADAIAMARQIAEAVESAHELGIVHRDLKPGNVMVRADKTVKVLDFGLAKSHHGADTVGVTMTADTGAGHVVGTPAYMSPEQARGEPVDRRTDIWAFGCIVFEMLTGQHVFRAKSTSEMIANLLTAEIDWTRLPPGVPPAVRYLLERCLERDSRTRLRDIGEARVLLENAAIPRQLDASRSSASRIVLPAMAALVAGLLLGGGAIWWTQRNVDAPLVTHTSILLPEGRVFNYPGRRFIAIAPSGRQVAYTAGEGMWLRALDNRDARVLPGVPLDARNPFFSPDGQSIGYYALGALWRVSLTGGAPVRITRAVNPWGASWAQDGTIVYGQGPEGIWRVPASGGEGVSIVAANGGETLHGPQLLPGGEWVLFTVLPAGVGLWDQAQIAAQSISTGERIVLLGGGRDARYLPSGHLVYGLNGALLAAPFDARTRQVGVSVSLVNGVADAGTLTAAVQFDVATVTGALAYVPRSLPNRLTLAWVDRTGRETPLSADARPYRHPRVSPHGSRLVVEVQDPGDTNIWIGDTRGTFTPLTVEPGEDSFPLWSPDGSRVVFFSARNDGGLFARSAEASGIERRLVSGTQWRPNTWAGERLVYEQLRGADIQVGTADKDTPSQTMTLLDDALYYDMMQPVVSPDGRLLAYHSSETGQLEVYVRPFPNIDDDKRRVSTAGGYSPVWSPDGRELYYLGTKGGIGRAQRLPDGQMMAVTVGSRPALTVDTPQPLFSLRDYVFPVLMSREYDVAPDGRFLMLKDVVPGGSRVGEQIVFVQHWIDEVTRRVDARSR